MHNHFHHYFNLKSDIHELYFSLSLRTFAIMLINIFVPIYLIKNGYSLQSVFWYYAAISGAHGLITFPAAKLSSRIGLKHLILISTPFLILNFLLLYSLDKITLIGVPIWTIGVVGGISNGLFWVGHHTEFVESSKKESTGKQLGIVKILVSIFQTIGPIVGGFLLAWFDFPIVFIIVSVILALSVIPLLMTEDKHEPFKFSFKDFNKLFRTKEVIGHVGFGVESSIHLVVWPIFIFYFVLGEKLTTLGTISSLSLLFSLFITYLIANNMDKKPNFFNDLGAIMNSVVWIVKNFIKTSIGVFFIDSVAGLTRTTQNISFNKICYDKARKSKTLQYIVLREFTINCGHAATYIGLSLITGVASYYTIAFIAGAVGSLMFLTYRA